MRRPRRFRFATGPRPGRSAPRLRTALAGAAILLLVACGGELQTPGEALRIFGDDLPRAYAGEPYDEQVRAVGGLRPFTFRVQEGELPPGLSLEAGVLTGIPTRTGTFEFTIVVSDANLSRTFQEYSLEVVERPPPTLELLAPDTEIRAPTTIRLRVDNASELRALATVVTWDESRFELVEGSVAASIRGAALVWREAAGELHLEMAALGDPWNGELTVAQFTLSPTTTSDLSTDHRTLFIDDRGRSHFEQRGGVGERVEEEGEAGDAEPEDPDPLDVAGPVEGAADEAAGEEESP